MYQRIFLSGQCRPLVEVSFLNKTCCCYPVDAHGTSCSWDQGIWIDFEIPGGFHPNNLKHCDDDIHFNLYDEVTEIVFLFSPSFSFEASSVGIFEFKFLSIQNR